MENEPQVELIQWFKRMGYDSQMPDSLRNISNKSTTFIWIELMQNARPKEEVKNLRNNVIINRLKHKSINKQDEFDSPNENIGMFLRRQELEKKLNNIQYTIKEKMNKVNSQSTNNRLKYIAIDNFKKQIKERKEREYLLGLKCKVFEKDIQKAEETLSFAKNLTPVELDENPSTSDITNTLHECALKLEELLKEIPMHHNRNNSTQNSLRFYSAQKEMRRESIFEKHLIRSDCKFYTKNVLKSEARSTKQNCNKENFGGEHKISKNLFALPTAQNKTENRRESLGILPDSCLNYNELDVLKEIDSVDKIFSARIYSVNEFDSYVPLPKPIDLTVCTEHLNVPSRNQTNKGFSFDKFYKDEFVSKSLRNMLYNNNRQIIMNTFQVMFDNLSLEATKNIILKSEATKKNKNINQEDIAKLQLLHIDTELEALKLKALLKSLLSKVMRKKKMVYAALNSKGLPASQAEHIGNLLESQLLDIALDVSLAEMKKEINSLNKNEGDKGLHVTLGKIAQTKKDIVQKIDTVKQYVDEVYSTLGSTARTREATAACVRKLGPFVEDMAWSDPLTESVFSAEMKTFENFPLEYNRRCTYTDSRVHYRDITDNIPEDADLKDDMMYMLANILESPFAAAETVVLDVLKAKIKLHALQSLPSQSVCVDNKKYSLEDLQAQESYLQYSLDKLNSIIFSTSANKTLNTVDWMKNVMEIWLEMPIKDFVSSKRTVEGSDYKFYEKQYDSFYKS